jgi:hypothetical protein
VYAEALRADDHRGAGGAERKIGVGLDKVGHAVEVGGGQRAGPASGRTAQLRAQNVLRTLGEVGASAQRPGPGAAAAWLVPLPHHKISFRRPGNHCVPHSGGVSGAFAHRNGDHDGYVHSAVG